ncbi:hypothetical protein [Cytobacillus kochii]|uniref:hypothetical protein n=1 Tax=Cytobacillus kochii TaxID=859143 RepID=UPI00203B67ED|nr:hypothetical protein [Cytobacillus kochii]MCM3324809.1 hypothetical protein [Cytobacillus kochii]MCM3347202.1 hypothetical protein [Cytobacillus kochii]
MSTPKEKLFNKLIDGFEPKIKYHTLNTHPQEREDLEQEIKIKIYEKSEKLVNLETPGFWDFIRNISQETQEKEIK